MLCVFTCNKKSATINGFNCYGTSSPPAYRFAKTSLRVKASAQDSAYYLTSKL